MVVRRIILLSALSLVLLAGCQSRRGPVDEQAPVRGPATRDHLLSEIAPPPGIDEDHITPLSGDELAKAQMPLAKVLKTLPIPAFMDPATRPLPATTDTPAEPPLPAQKAYIQAREAWQAGDSTETKQQLEAALRLAPNQPTLLRLLGEVYTRTGNRIKGAQYFRQAVELEPGDARSVFILGRFAIEKGDHAEAVLLFHDALTKADDDAALTELSHHFLGNALRSMGHAAAAIEQFDQYVALTDQPIQASRFARDQALLRRQIGITRQLMGDLNMNLNRPAQALAAYDQALEAGVPDRVKVDKRKTYAALKLKNAELARSLVIDQVQRQNGDAQSLAMVRYIVSQGVNANALARALQTIYESQGRPAELVIATADVMPGKQARALLIEHLRQKPADREVFHRLLRYYLLPAETAPYSEKELTEATGLTAEMMTLAPGLADEYGSALVTHVHDTQALLEVIDGDAGEKQDPTMRIVLRGLCLAVLTRFDEAQAQFEQAVKLSPDLQVARIELAKALFVQDDFDRAAEVLKPLSDATDTGVILLRARVLAQTDQVQEAIELIERVIRETGGDARLVITQANLELKLGRATDAEQTLLDALNADPTAEPIYEALLDLYDPAPGRTSPIEDQTAKWRVLVKRLLGTIPNSRTGRLVQAQLHDASRNYDQAATILEGLLAENPDDAKALNQLLDTYHAAGRTGEAIALLETRLEADPDNVLLLQMALQFYGQTGDQERLFQVQERLLLLEPESSERAGRLGFLYTKWNKHQQAIDVLEAALAEKDVTNPTVLVSLLATALTEIGEPELAEKKIREAAKRFPEQEAELNYLLAVSITGRGDQAKGEQVMRDNLAKHPDHGPTNNGLGYAMLMRNEDPQKALDMIQRAVDGDPDNEAYTDSLGWAYYKLARYEDAEVWLRKARDLAIARVRSRQGGAGATLAVVSDHLGDTLYRLGREGDALRAWSEAASHMRTVTPEDLTQDPELTTMNDRLRDKIQALRAKTPVPVAEVPAPPTPPATVEEPTKPQPKPKAEPKAEPKPQPKAEAKPEPKPEPEPEAKPEPEAQQKPKPGPVTEPAKQAEPKSNAKPAPDPVPQAPADAPVETPDAG
ncbi:MAG: tetratricopeptide repeat protein [Phycisphaerales bacterium]